MIRKQVLAFGNSEKSEFINIGIFAASSGGRKGRCHIGRFMPDRERSHVCLCYSHMAKTGFLTTWLICIIYVSLLVWIWNKLEIDSSKENCLHGLTKHICNKYSGYYLFTSFDISFPNLIWCCCFRYLQHVIMSLFTMNTEKHRFTYKMNTTCC